MVPIFSGRKLIHQATQERAWFPRAHEANAVGCVAVCQGAMTARAMAPALFGPEASQHGAAVEVQPGGGSAMWRGSSCNQVAFLQPLPPQPDFPQTVSYSVMLEGSADFVDIGWCSPSLDATGKSWVSAGGYGLWMGAQGPGKDWIFRKSGLFKASDSPDPAAVAPRFCLPDDDKFDRSTVRPWEPAVLSTTRCGGSCAGSSWAPCGGSVFFDVELGAPVSPTPPAAAVESPRRALEVASKATCSAEHGNSDSTHAT